MSELNITDGITEIDDGAFADCISLESVNIPASVKNIGIAAFYGCENLGNIVLPATIDFIGDIAFKNCEKVMITGEAGSCTEEYAAENNIPFELFEEMLPGEEDTKESTVPVTDELLQEPDELIEEMVINEDLLGDTPIKQDKQ